MKKIANEGSWHSYPKVYNVGHAAISGRSDLTDGPVTVEEKVDGSQLSFGVFNGELKLRSKGREFDPGDADKMFLLAVESVESRRGLLVGGWTYRGEYLQKPKHNSLTYGRVPQGNIIIFDVEIGDCKFLDRTEKEKEAERIGLEVVPLIFSGEVSGIDQITGFLGRESVLGGPQIEGVVIKNYEKFTRDGKVMLGKYVSGSFKEVHQKEWKKSNPTARDVVAVIGSQYRTEARWEKSIQHMRDDGLLTETTRDIGPLIKLIGDDIKIECTDEIMKQLFAWAWPHIQRMSARGFAEFYKKSLDRDGE